MRFEIHLQKLQERFGLAHGEGQVQRARVVGLAVEFQAHRDFVGRHAVRFELFALLAEQARDQEQQRLEQFDRVIEFDAAVVGVAG